jgi:hypothetical protein
MPRVNRFQSRPRASDGFVPLNKCEVVRTTERAVLIVFDVKSPSGEEDEVELWVPRSVCEEGDGLDEGDKDIRVKRWFVEKNDLPV